MSWVTSSAMLTPSTAISCSETSKEMAHRGLGSTGRVSERGTRSDTGKWGFRKTGLGFADREQKNEDDDDDDDEKGEDASLEERPLNMLCDWMKMMLQSLQVVCQTCRRF